MNPESHSPEVKKESVYEKQVNDLAQMIRKLGYKANIFTPVHTTNDPERKDFLIKFMVGNHSVEAQCEGAQFKLVEIINEGQSESSIPIEGDPGVSAVNEEMLRKVFEAEFGEKYIQ